MTEKRAILEYRMATTDRKPSWGFSFKTPDGEPLVESVANFSSMSEAEQGFVDMIKWIATNAYTIHTTRERSLPSAGETENETV